MGSDTDGRHDFDFLHGKWTIRNRYLKQRLRQCEEWEEFEATHECHPAIGGMGNLEQYHAVLPDGRPLDGMSVRTFDPATGEWSIYWADNSTGKLLPPVIGRFANGRGMFSGDDECDGIPVRVVYFWTGVDTGNPVWEQAFSTDEGVTWETNWRMFFTHEG